MKIKERVYQKCKEKMEDIVEDDFEEIILEV